MGYIHRDLKPENIVLNLSPLEVRIIDFDLANLNTINERTLGVGTPGYHPEKVPWRDGSARWDVWALVAIICEADMPKDRYKRWDREHECIREIRAHNSKKTTCANLGYLLLHSLLSRNYEEMLSVREVMEVL